MARFALHLLIVLVSSALTAAAILAHRAPDLSGIKQEPLESATAAPPSTTAAKPDASAKSGPKGNGEADLLSLIEQASIKQTGAIEITEAQLNAHLAQRLRTSSDQTLAGLLTGCRLLIDLQPDAAHLHLIWDLRGHPLIATARLGIERQRDTFRITILDGSYGSLHVPRGLLTPLIPALHTIAAAAQPELRALFKMPKIRLTEDRLVLDPRF